MDGRVDPKQKRQANCEGKLMAFDYTEMLDMVDDCIAEFGSTVLLHKFSRNTFKDASTPWRGPNNAQDHIDQATELVAQLLVNGSFEDDALGVYNTASPLTGWTHPVESIELWTSHVGLNAFQGANYVLGVDAVPANDSEIYQEVSVISGGATEALVDAGVISVTLTSRRANAGTLDEGRVRMEFRRADSSLISTAYDTGSEAISPTNSWVARNSGLITLPAGTRRIGVRFGLLRVLDTHADSGIDAVILTSYNTGAVSLPAVYVVLSEGGDNFGLASAVEPESISKEFSAAFMVSGKDVTAQGIDLNTYDYATVNGSATSFIISKVVELKPGSTSLMHYILLER